MTSRRQIWPTFLIQTTRSLEMLERNESLALLVRFDPPSPDTQPVLNDICEELEARQTVEGMLLSLAQEI